MTSEAQYDYWPTWTPDGRRIAFTSYRPGPSGLGLFWQPADGSGSAERLTTSMYWPVARSFTPDGKLLVFQQFWESNAGFAIWVLPLEPRGEPRPLLRASYNQYQPSRSPDGRWLAYVSNESGRDEIYVRPFPGLEAKWQISTEGGAEPAWAHSGRELFYRTGPRPGAGNKLMAVSIITQPAFHAGTPQVVVDGSYAGSSAFSQSYDVAPDGKRFVMVKSEPTNAPREITVVLNWFEELDRRLPAGPR